MRIRERMTDDFREYTGQEDIGAGKEPPTAVHDIFAHKKYLSELYR